MTDKNPTPEIVKMVEESRKSKERVPRVRKPLTEQQRQAIEDAIGQPLDTR